MAIQQKTVVTIDTVEYTQGHITVEKLDEQVQFVHDNCDVIFTVNLADLKELVELFSK